MAIGFLGVRMLSDQQIGRLVDIELEFLEQVATRRPARRMLDELCRRLEGLVPGAICSVMKFDQDTERLKFLAAPGAPHFLEEGTNSRKAGLAGACGTSTLRRGTVIVEDAQSSDQWREFRDVAMDYGIRSCWSTALMSSDGVALGTLALTRRVAGAPTVDDLHILETGARLARIILEHGDDLRGPPLGKPVSGAVSQKASNIWANLEEIEDKSVVDHAHRLASLGALTSGIAHDLNNLLTGSLGNVDLALADTSEHNPAYSRLIMAQKATTMAADLCRQMLAFTGRASFKPKLVSLPLLVTEAYGLIKGTVEQRADVTFDFARQLPEVRAEPTQISQVVLNVLLNAAESIADGRGHISLSVTLERHPSEQPPDGATVKLRIRDSGAGMDPKTLQRVFDPMYTTKPGGRGLGLTAVREIVNRHGGQIDIESQLGRGTAVNVYLPAAVESLTTAKFRRPSSRDRGKILVIDDEETVLDVAMTVLRNSRFDVYGATNGRDGIEQFQKHAEEIKLVLLDLTLPRLGGLEVLKRLTAIRRDVRVILSSGYPDGVRMATPVEQVCSFLRKPYRPRDLLAAVRSALA